MKKRTFIISLIISVSFIDAFAQSDKWTSGRPDGHAPIGVMGDHYHAKGEWMFSYRYMRTPMDGNIMGSNDISNETIFDQYMVAPQEMSMQMHMIGAMYAFSDRLTLMAMANYMVHEMDLKTQMGQSFTTGSSGFGDASLAALIKLLNANRQSLHLNIGIGIPVGSITQRDNTPAMDNMKLPYPMQSGSGTWNPSFGMTYLGQSDILSWGFQPSFTVRTGENSEEYRLGNILSFNAWSAVKANEWFSFSLRGAYLQTGPIKGADPELNPMMAPPGDFNNTGRESVSLFTGGNFYIPSGFLENIRLGIEAGLPVYQHAEGIQMEQAWSFTAGIQYSLGGQAH